MYLYIASEDDRQERPYSTDNTASRLLSEVKHCLVQLVLRWGTTLESWMLFFCFSYTRGKKKDNFFLVAPNALDDIVFGTTVWWGITSESNTLLFCIQFLS